MSALIFDLDGVLIESEPFWQRELARVANAHARDTGGDDPGLTQADMVAYEGGRVTDTVRAVLAAIGHPSATDDAVVDELAERVIGGVTSAFAAEPVPIASTVAVARALAERGVPMGVASSSAPSFIDAVVDALGLGDAITVTQSALPLAEGKPHPEVYLRAAERLEVSPRACVTVEDSETGVRAALAAETACIGLWRKEFSPPAVFADCRLVTSELTLAQVEAVLREIDDAPASTGPAAAGAGA